MALSEAVSPFEVEHRGDDMKLQASLNGGFDPVKAGEVDDDGRFPKRDGICSMPSTLVQQYKNHTR